jgi:hypothetical protein
MLRLGQNPGKPRYRVPSGFSAESARHHHDTWIIAQALNLPGRGIRTNVDLSVGDTVIDRRRHPLSRTLERHQQDLTRLAETGEVLAFGNHGADFEGAAMAHLVHSPE